MKYKITIEYNGTGYVGWQAQPNHSSIQEQIEQAITKFSNEKPSVYGAGRTDAGVHALGQVAHFSLQKEYNEHSILQSINYFLKDKAIAILNIQKVPEDFHARFSAKKRRYIYKIINRKAPLCLEYNLAWHVHKELDTDKMQKGADFLIGTHDFSTFRASECQAKSAIKTIDKISITQNQESIIFDIVAQSFLHHQVRNIVGTLQQVGLKKWSPQDIQTAKNKKNRQYGGITAPAYGLYFHSVIY